MNLILITCWTLLEPFWSPKRTLATANKKQKRNTDLVYRERGSNKKVLYGVAIVAAVSPATDI